MTKKLTGPALVAYLRDNPTSDAMRAAADEIERLRAALEAMMDYAGQPISHPAARLARAALAQGET